jgi:drug/metabolite transporter (DMT)-like permease
LQPVFAAFTAILFFGEKITLIHICAACLIFTGIYLVNKKAN